ncbi:hypothetical protein [Campylobacter jejuni]|uniref:hypothetical protein n=1 Tax=Campylobacter jejuni TaxID=197 RepID=UPI0011A9F8CD|nr:hypothetical protein [Campylobacter jejuni]
MQIPIYSKLKTKLESKGIDNTSSGQIAWCLGSGCIALICAVFVVVYKLKNLEFELYIVFFFLSCYFILLYFGLFS